MITNKHYVIDTNSIIATFPDVFSSDVSLSQRTQRIIASSLRPYESNIKISIPSIVFIEIYKKWIDSEENYRKFYYNVYKIIIDSPNIEVRPIDREILENLQHIGGTMESHDLHDKIILASAIALECCLITTDHTILQYVESSRIIPAIIN